MFLLFLDALKMSPTRGADRPLRCLDLKVQEKYISTISNMPAVSELGKFSIISGRFEEEEQHNSQLKVVLVEE